MAQNTDVLLGKLNNTMEAILKALRSQTESPYDRSKQASTPKRTDDKNLEQVERGLKHAADGLAKTSNTISDMIREIKVKGVDKSGRDTTSRLNAVVDDVVFDLKLFASFVNDGGDSLSRYHSQLVRHTTDSIKEQSKLMDSIYDAASPLSKYYDSAAKVARYSIQQIESLSDVAKELTKDAKTIDDLISSMTSISGILDQFGEATAGIARDISDTSELIKSNALNSLSAMSEVSKLHITAAQNLAAEFQTADSFSGLGIAQDFSALIRDTSDRLQEEYSSTAKLSEASKQRLAEINDSLAKLAQDIEEGQMQAFTDPDALKHLFDEATSFLEERSKIFESAVSDVMQTTRESVTFSTDSIISKISAAIAALPVGATETREVLMKAQAEVGGATVAVRTAAKEKEMAIAQAQYMKAVENAMKVLNTQTLDIASGVPKMMQEMDKARTSLKIIPKEIKKVISEWAVTTFSGAAAINKLGEAAKGTYEMFTTMTRAGLADGPNDMYSSFLNMHVAALNTRMSFEEMTKFMSESNQTLSAQMGGFKRMVDTIGAARKSLLEFGISGLEAAETVAALADSAGEMGINLQNSQELNSVITTQIDLYKDLSSVTGVAIQDLAKNMKAMLGESSMRNALLRLSKQERINKVNDLIMMQKSLVLQGASNKLAEEIIKTQQKALNEKFSSRMEGASKLLQLAGALGMGGQGSEAFQILMKGNAASAEEQMQLASIMKDIGAQAEAQRGSSFAADELYATLSEGIPGMIAPMLEQGREMTMAEGRAQTAEQAAERRNEKTLSDMAQNAKDMVDLLTKVVGGTVMTNALLGMIAAAVAGGKLFNLFRGKEKASAAWSATKDAARGVWDRMTGKVERPSPPQSTQRGGLVSKMGDMLPKGKLGGGLAGAAIGIGSSLLLGGELDWGETIGSAVGGALGTALGPVGMVVGSLIGGWVGKLVTEVNWSEIFNPLIEKTKAVFSFFGTMIGDAVKTTYNTVSEVASTFASAVQSTFDLITSTISNSIKSAISSIRSFVSSAVDFVLGRSKPSNVSFAEVSPGAGIGLSKRELAGYKFAEKKQETNQTTVNNSQVNNTTAPTQLTVDLSALITKLEELIEVNTQELALAREYYARATRMPTPAVVNGVNALGMRA